MNEGDDGHHRQENRRRQENSGKSSHLTAPLDTVERVFERNGGKAMVINWLMASVLFGSS
jgi:hypothetical protein